ncbi:MAG: cystathionine beta-lyase [Pseudomonadota bacterium]
MTNSDRDDARGINTRLAHDGYNPRDYHGFVNPPVVHASTVLYPSAESMRDREVPYTYGTAGTPTTDAVARATDALEGSFSTICVPSGLAAITIPLLAFLSAGDHVLVVDTVYFPTRRFLDGMMVRYGIEVEYYVPEVGADIEKLFKSNTKVLFMESPASNTFEMSDIGAMTAVARPRGIVTMIDNTYATPLFFKPLDHGVDLSIHASTKYPAGHSDLVFGTVSATEATWQTLRDCQIHTGVCVQGDDAYQVLRGMRTMGIRLERHQRSALEIAQWLQTQEGVGRVLHPALPDHPGHEIWKRDFCGSTGIFSFVLEGAGVAQADAFLNALEIFGLGYSWAGFESLAVNAQLGDRTVSKRDYGGPVIRLQIGLEDVPDLKADLEKALAAARAA